MIAAIVTAVAVGLAGPSVGAYLVQRKMSLLGDGIGHIALTGVALGVIAGTALNLSNPNALAVPGAMIVSLAGALIVDQMQSRGGSRPTSPSPSCFTAAPPRALCCSR